MRTLLIVLTVLALPLSADTIDKLAITVGHDVITELGIDEDMRVAALINGQPIERTLDSRRAAADRLVQRLLIQHEMEVSRYPLPDAQESDLYLQHLETTLGGPDKFMRLLSSYSLNEATVKEYLTSQLTMLRFIEYRFSPDVSVSDAEIDAAYLREVLDNKPGPMNETRRNAISEKLAAERTDAALDAWLAESRKQVTIVYMDKTLQ